MDEKTTNILKMTMLESFKNKNTIDNIKKEINKLNKHKSMLEENIINIMEDLNLDKINYTHEKTNEKIEINLQVSKKKKGLTNKIKKQNCIMLCNGDEEKAEQIFNYLYDKSARDKKIKETISYKLLK